MQDQTVAHVAASPLVQPLGEALQSQAAWCVYECIAADGTMLYVGFTGRGGGRLADHIAKPWWVATDFIQLTHYDDEATARAHEAQLIASLRPLFNITSRPVGPPAMLCSVSHLVAQINERDAEVARLTAEVTALRVVVWLRQRRESNDQQGTD